MSLNAALGEYPADILEGHPTLWDDELQQFRPEYWAYHRLNVFQGTVLPHIYGFYNVILRHGESCVALVMEYIDAIPSKDLKQVVDIVASPPQALNVTAAGLSASTHALHALQVHQSDLTARNFLWTYDSIRHGCGPVAIDFGRAIRLGLYHRSRSFIEICNTLIEYKFQPDDVKAWVRSTLTADSTAAKMFDVENEEVGLYEDAINR
ncbi:hypothetical protein EXIGLDRAFT_834765 [Exidia glandulosa HHB12029]|uniref:Protein kinase domain-containing protein n=1 Tax=Exidia glandulosa HHB12029 TaxID=1314781 RepID=A0A165JG85_EXIGL|nr:hypothetical protein EXIGLDRAFT_834765 [Exidia glandulosa HHB12029]